MPAELPESFGLPSLPPALDAWFALVADLGDDSELTHGGDVLDGLGVVDAASALQALVGYRFVREGDTWVDTVERGSWRANWLVLDSINADPVIADLSTPQIAVLADEHGRGSWDPTPVAASLAEFVAGLVRIDVPRTTDDGPLFDWSVWAVDLGPEPAQALVALKRWPLFETYSPAELLRLRRSLPTRLADGLTEELADSCVAYGDRLGATFEARTFRRGSVDALAGVDLDTLWSDQVDDDYTEPSPSDQLIESLEAELGYRLPDAWVELARTRNGGTLRLGAHPMAEPTGWAEDHIAVTGLFAIGRTSRSSLGGELGARFMREEWGYPDLGIGIADTPSAGHELVMLDYRECGPTGEPRVVHVDQEAGYRVSVVAPDFASFVRGLVDPEEL